MWPFSKRSSQAHLTAPHPQDMPNFSEHEKCDCSMKVWLPQVLVDRVNWVSRATDASRPDVIRALLFEHLYGRVAYLGLQRYQAEKEREASRRRPSWSSTAEGQAGEDEIKVSRSRDTHIDLSMLGKSDGDLTVTLPSRLKQDLAELAQTHRLTPSSYVRKMLVLQLLGEPTHTRWQHALGKISPDVAVLERED